MEVRQVTFPELYRILSPYVVGYKWGRDTIRDLWLKGAPVPQDVCPGGVPCKAYPYCNHIRRFIYPNHLQEWWDDVSDRVSLDIAVSAVFERH